MVWYDPQDLPPGLSIVTRDQWEANEPLPQGSIKVLLPHPLDLPVSRVRFNCTGSRMCTSREDCAKLLKQCQENYVDIGHYDILHNFMVGSDGTIYEGRGWNLRPDIVLGKYKNSTIEIAYIGFFMENNPFDIMIDAANRLIQYGIQAEKIKPDYKAVWFRDLFETERIRA